MGRIYHLNVNGFSTDLNVSEETLSQTVDTLLENFYELRRQKGRRVIVFIAGMPGAGKSTLVQLLCERAKEKSGPYACQALGLDGFHYRKAVLESRTTVRNGISVRLADIKGSPETFDCHAFTDCVRSAAGGAKTLWPLYDRRKHEPSDDPEAVTGDILLVEGNWLLLKDDQWASARAFCDRTVWICAKAEDMKPRLIARKMRGGRTQAEAEEWYDSVDGPNCKRAETDSVQAEINVVWND